MKKNKVKKLTLSDLETYCKTMVLKGVVLWKNSQTEQQNRIESSEKDPQIQLNDSMEKG